MRALSSLPMQHTCASCSQSYDVTKDDLAFYDSVSPVIAGKKQSLPPPTHCPDCRQRRRLSHCNERNLVSGECGMCKKRTLTQYGPQDNQPYYCRECWHSDKWDAKTYGRDVDFTRPFLDQLRELELASPAQALNVQGSLQNSDYIHYAGSSKNCYLIMHADFCEDCYYGYGFKHNLFCVDGFYNLQCQFCYDCVDCNKCHGLTASQDCINCHTSAFLVDCVGCQDCFLCTGLRNKKYCFENQQLSKEEYQKKTAAIDLSSHSQYQKMRERLNALQLKHPRKEFQGHNLQDSTGNHLTNCKDVRESFDCEDVEGGAHLYQVVTGAKNVHDVYQYGLNLQNSYECAICGENSQSLLFCRDCHMSCSDLMYCCYMESSKNCFGCSHMQRASYCILNKQYTKEEYEALVPKIVEHMKKGPSTGSGQAGEWGEFMPLKNAGFGYNKTTAQLYYPRTKAQVAAEGLVWDDSEPAAPVVQKTIPADRLPDGTAQVPDDILQWAITCEATAKPFRVTQKELAFYREHRLPIPRRSPEQRHLDRFARRNPRTFWDRTCDQCSKAIKTTYSPDRPEKVLCEDCYQKAVY